MGGNIKKKLLLLLSAFILGMSACSGGSGEEMFETAQFEEMQKNTGHAVKLYEEIIEKYPDSEYAVKAKERLSVLSGE